MDQSDDTDRVVDSGRITISREQAFARRLVETYDPDLFSSEQDCWEESAQRRIKQCDRGTSPEQIFEDLRERVAAQGGALPVVLVDDDLAVATPSDKPSPLLTLDDEDRMELERLSRTELVDRVGRNLADASVEELATIIAESASRDVLIRMAAGFLGGDDSQ